MKRILKFLARLYPSTWRNRYGAEYEALLEQATPRARDAVDVFWGAIKMQTTTWSLVRIMLVCSLAGALAAVALSFTRPTLYASQTLISVDTSDRSSIDNELAADKDEFLASPVLISIIQKENLYPGERTRMPLNQVVDLMRKNILILPLHTRGGEGAPGFLLEFAYSDPHVAQRVDEELASGLVTSNLRIRSASAATTDFLKDQLGAVKDPAMKARIQSQLRQAEDRKLQLHEFRVIHPADLPKSPFFPKRGLFGVGGLFLGLVGGLVVAAIAGWHRKVTVANG
jgi:hypothetical protein